jgi:hypothetical protein
MGEGIIRMGIREIGWGGVDWIANLTGVVQ